MEPEVLVNRFSDFKTLINYNVDRISDSYFNDKRLLKALNEIVTNGEKGKGYKSRMLSVKINGFIAGVDLIFIFKGIYCPMLCGNRLRDFPGIGNYLTLLDIDDAIDLKMKLIDFSESDEGCYKDKLFTKVEQYALSFK